MGGWARTLPTTYFVAWPDGVFKVGYSERQRWRRFVLRGARVIRLVPFEDFRDAFALEEECHFKILCPSAPKAFKSRFEATEHLGADGGGWMECYQLTPELCDRICVRISECTCDRICHRIADLLHATQRNATNATTTQPGMIFSPKLTRANNRGFQAGATT